MKTLFKSVLFIIALMTSFPESSWAELPEGGPIETEVIESVLDKAKLGQSEAVVRIEVASGVAFEVDRHPNIEKMRESLGLNIPEKVRQQILARGGTIENVDPLAAFDHLSDEQQKEFHKTRVSLLANIARILYKTQFVFGAGSLVGDGFSFVKMKVKKAFGSEVQAEPREARAFRERSRLAVQSILQGVDYKLWSQAPLVIDSNEFGLSVSVGLIAETGVFKRGGGGAEELGLSFAYNKKSRAMVFEIFHNSEKFENTKAAMSVVGIVGKLGFAMFHKEVGFETRTMKGSSFYPPAIPGFSTSGSDMFLAGASSSLGLPPPPLADLLTFTNSFERNALIRITVSPLVKGFVRIQFGDVKGSIRLVAARFVDVYTAISDKVHRYGRKSCGPVFASL
ncbi:hypothetical protein D3C87_162420 [compost metagenome]